MKATKISKKAYTHHSVEYKTEALKLVEPIGVPDVARQLGLHESQLYQWRNQQQHQHSVSQREQEQATEIARLRRELASAQEAVAILKQASAYFARQIKWSTPSPKTTINGLTWKLCAACWKCSAAATTTGCRISSVYSNINNGKPNSTKPLHGYSQKVKGAGVHAAYSISYGDQVMPTTVRR